MVQTWFPIRNNNLFYSTLFSLQPSMHVLATHVNPERCVTTIVLSTHVLALCVMLEPTVKYVSMELETFLNVLYTELIFLFHY